MAILREIISDVDGSPSTKRIIAIWLTFATTAIAINNAFFHGTIEALATMATLTTTIYAAITAERWGKSQEKVNVDITKTNP